MNLVINCIKVGSVIYSVYFIIINKISFRKFLKITFNKYTVKDIIVGILISFLAILGIYLVELSLGYIKIESINKIDRVFLNTFMMLALMAFVEELFFRGFMLNGFVLILKNKYLAITIAAVLFGLAHSSNPNATMISIIGNGLDGAIYSIAFIESDSLWLPFALHFSWNFFQGSVFGFPVSGLNLRSIVQQSSVAGKNIFTGGSYGPEGGIMGLTFRITVTMMLLMIYYYFNIKRRDGIVNEEI